MELYHRQRMTRAQQHIVIDRRYVRCNVAVSAGFDKFLLGVESRGSGRQVPSGVQGQSPSRGLGKKNEVPQKLKHFSIC